MGYRMQPTPEGWALERGVYVPLEDYYGSVTFIEGGRRAMPLSLVHRGRAMPRAAEPETPSTGH